MKFSAFFGLCLLLNLLVKGQETSVSTIATDGWSNNSVNTVIFRKNALTTFKNHQYAAFYNADQFVVLAKRKLNSRKWDLAQTQYKGDAADAHKSISIIIDNSGYLHISWGQHNNNLNYARSLNKESLVLGNKEQMTGLKENKVSYPEFYKLPTGNLLFFYRDGGSGNGNLMINQYDVKTNKWRRLQDNLIDGEGQRNAYLQTAIDVKGTIHLSWTWRESSNVASNHDLCYAKSTDGGLTWIQSDGKKYELPITVENAEYALKIPQNSELINQTSMYADENGNPYIATYWRSVGETVPQYHIVYKRDNSWQVNKLSFRSTPFTLSGTGTKKIPISRPQLICWSENNQTAAVLIFRDLERGNKVSVARNNDLSENKWILEDLTNESVGEWEPNFDLEMWTLKKRLDLFVQKVDQLDSEGKANSAPTAVKVLSWKPNLKNN